MTTTITAVRTLLEVAGSRVIEHVVGAETNGAVALLEFAVEPSYPMELLTPAGFEGYFRAAAATLHRGAAPTPEPATTLMNSYGVTPA